MLFTNEKVKLTTSFLFLSVIDKQNSVALALLMHMFNAFKCEMFTSLVSQSRENEIRHCIVGGNGGRVGCEHILPHKAMQVQCSCPTSPLSSWTSVGSGWLLFPFATPASRPFGTILPNPCLQTIVPSLVFRPPKC